MLEKKSLGQQITFNEEFVRALEESPEKVLMELGLEPAPEAIAAIREMDFESLYSLAETFSRMSREEVALIFP